MLGSMFRPSLSLCSTTSSVYPRVHHARCSAYWGFLTSASWLGWGLAEVLLTASILPLISYGSRLAASNAALTSPELVSDTQQTWNREEETYQP